HIYMSGTNLDTTTKTSFAELIRESLPIFRYFMKTGVSAICTKATPVLEKLLNIMNSQDHPDSSARSETVYNHEDSSHQRDIRLLDEYIENLAPQQWLSPSNMGWEGWAMILDEPVANVFGA
ncbi:hypothetical protein ACHAPD_007872, partial [Fusarium lateritium]